jgi:phospholipid/cholesterol/gamma-HCH transport system permease protein
MARSPGQHGTLYTFVEQLGDWVFFSFDVLRGLAAYRTWLPTCPQLFFEIGIRSVVVILATGLFLGMVLAMQAFHQFRSYGFETAIGSISVVSILAELGPVLAAVMLAGRVGSSMSAELGTMQISDQMDALSCMGVNPIHYLATPRFLGCLILVPMLTLFADLAGIVGSVLIAVQFLGVDGHHFWQQTQATVRLWDAITGIMKAFVFGGLIALISCHRGFKSQAGAKGVGEAATQSFVLSFLAILISDFLLVTLFGRLRANWPV